MIKSDFYLAELVDHWWDLETLLENGALTLDADILGPLDEAGQVTLWLDITTLKVGLLAMLVISKLMVEKKIFSKCSVEY